MAHDEFLVELIKEALASPEPEKPKRNFWLRKSEEGEYTKLGMIRHMFVEWLFDIGLLVYIPQRVLEEGHSLPRRWKYDPQLMGIRAWRWNVKAGETHG